MSLVKSLTLNNYRNHQTLTLQFGERINLLIGGNAQGKTNILESIYLLGRGRSFRSNEIRDLITWGESDCRVEAVLQRDEGENDAIAYVDGERKHFKMDGKKKRKIDIGVVLFVPQDITIFRDLPQERRSYIDEFFCGIDRIYETAHKDYKRALSQRNKMLKEGQEGGWNLVEAELETWTDRLVELGTSVISKRKERFDEINELLPQMYKYMGGVGKEAHIEYIIGFEMAGFGDDEIQEAFRRRLAEKRELERIRGVTLVGPHRDDWTACVDGGGLRSYGSQGQMRIMSIALKMVELRLVKRTRGDLPILLLDDVISELDDGTTEKLLKFIGEQEGQVMITSTKQHRLSESLKDGAKVFSISKENDGIY